MTEMWIKVYSGDITDKSELSDWHDGVILATSSWEAERRHPNRDEAREAARTLMACNGHDLDLWSNDAWQPDDDFLRNLAK